jgi:hypothetical protein
MINQQLLNVVLMAYKSHFLARWESEKFKWEAIQHFQTHWDINAPDFAEMFALATKKTNTLLTSMNYFPRRMIYRYAQHDAAMVRDMFQNLFDESRDVIERVAQFTTRANELQNTRFDPSRQSYQNINSISTYLWLMYPNKYYIYKHSEYLAVAKTLESTFVPKAGDYNRNLAEGFALYNELATRLAQDIEIKTMVTQVLTATCYPDTQLRTLTIDFGYFISQNIEPVTPLPLPAPIATNPDTFKFALEKHLEEFIIKNWSHTALGRDYSIYIDGETDGQQYQTDTGPIDILAISKDKKKLLVIELKKGRGSDAAVGQILRYMSFIKETLAQPGQEVYGAIITFEEDKNIRRALSMIQNVKYYRYQLHFDLAEQF